MICVVKLNVGIGGAEMPLAPVSVFAGSATTFIIEGVPIAKGGTVTTGVSLSVVNAAGVTKTERATRAPGRRCEWAVTFQDAHMAAAGRTEHGVTVTAFGVDERGESVTWILGVGDIEFVQVDAAVMENLGAYTNLRLLEAELETPHRGDLVKRDGGWSLYNGSSWEALGGSCSVQSVNGKTGAVQLTASDVGAAPAEHNHTSGDIYDLGAAVASIGAGQFAAKSHTHPAREITDMASATRYLLTQAATSASYIEITANRTKYVLLGGDTFGGSVEIVLGNDEIAGRVTDSVLLVMADRDTTVSYDTLGGYVTWLAADPSDVKTVKANTPTMLYFTQVRARSSSESAVYAIGKTELHEVA